MIGTAAEAGCLRRLLQTDRPSMPGRLRSRITRSGILAEATRSPLSPSNAVCTAYPPSFSRLYLSERAMSSSSSMIRIRFLASMLLGPAAVDRVQAAMPDHAPLGEVDDHLADVGRAVADPLEVLRDHHEPEGAADRARVLDHVREQLAKELLHEGVHLVVLADHGAGGVRVPPDEGVEAVLEHLPRDRRHPGDVDEGLEER